MTDFDLHKQGEVNTARKMASDGIPGKLAPYEAEVIKLRCEGMTYPSIHKIISEKGYEGSAASLRSFIQKERIRTTPITNAINM